MDAEKAAVAKDGPGLCRCCLSENAEDSAKKKKYPWMSDKTEVYSGMLRDCFNISISRYAEDPTGGNKNIICNECVILLKDAYQFKKQTVISEKKFADIMLARRKKRLKAMLAEQEGMEDDDDEVEEAAPAPTKYVKDGPGLCRCCLSGDGSFRDLAKRYPWMSEMEVYADMLRECFNIYVAQYSEGPTGVKNIICNVCVILLRDAYNFKKQIVTSLKKFAEIMVARKEKKTKETAVDQKDSSLKCENMQDEHTKGSQEQEAGSSSNVKLECKLELGETPDQLVCLPSGEWNIAAATLKPNKQPEAMHTPSDAQPAPKDNSSSSARTYVCETCNKSFTRKCRWFEHQLIHTGVKSFICDECGKSFYNKDSMQKHIKEIHSETKTKNREKIKEIHSDTKTEHDEKSQGINPTVNRITFDCESCGKIFNRNSVLEEHKLTHGEKTFACDLCHKSYFSKKKLEIHYRTHTGGNTYVCDTCGQVYKWKENLINHLHSHSGTMSFVCDVCSKSFASARLLKRHLSVVHSDTKPFSCHICGACFKEKSVMTKHLLIHNDQTFNCHICAKSFKVEHYLQIHMSSVHSSAERVICNICGKNYKIKKYLTQHMLLVHGGARPFACHICGKTFKLKVVLKDHLVRHDKSKSHTCGVCGKAFTAKSDVGKHMRKVHNKKKLNDVIILGC